MSRNADIYCPHCNTARSSSVFYRHLKSFPESFLFPDPGKPKAKFKKAFESYQDVMRRRLRQGALSRGQEARSFSVSADSHVVQTENLEHQGNDFGMDDGDYTGDMGEVENDADGVLNLDDSGMVGPHRLGELDDVEESSDEEVEFLEVDGSIHPKLTQRFIEKIKEALETEKLQANSILVFPFFPFPLFFFFFFFVVC